MDATEISKWFDREETIKNYLEYESMILADEVIENRLCLKRMNGKKINVLFICHRPTVWNTLKTVYNAFVEDEGFDVKILAIPNRKQLPPNSFPNEVYESEGAEEFWKGENCINGYNYETHQWVDPRSLGPDYVFYQQPYNICLPRIYKSWIVSKYARICYLSYGYQIAGGNIFESVYPMDFMRSVKMIFSSDKWDNADVESWFKKNMNTYTRVIMSGNPRFDLINENQTGKKNKKFTILWTPRWNTREDNCFFFDFKDRFLEYIDNHDEVSLIFRPHPQAFLEWNATGEMKEDEAKLYKSEYKKRKNAKIDENVDYLNTFKETDCFVTDMTSLMAEYIMTGKPVIYCHKTDSFTNAGREIAKSFYWVTNYEEMVEKLEMIRNGIDPLKEKRERIRNNLMGGNKRSAGYYIKEIIKRDAFGNAFEELSIEG